MKKEFTAPKVSKVEFTVAARLDGSGEEPQENGLHDSGAHTACAVKVNSKTPDFGNFCTKTNGKNSAGGSGIGTC